MPSSGADLHGGREKHETRVQIQAAASTEGFLEEVTLAPMMGPWRSRAGAAVGQA